MGTATERGIDYSQARTNRKIRLSSRGERRPFTRSDWNHSPSVRHADRIDKKYIIPQSGMIVNLSNRPEETNSGKKEFFFSKDWLQQEVAKVQRETTPEGKTPWYHLAGTGFYVKEQVDQLLRNTNTTFGEVAPDVLDLELAKVKEDVKHFEQEYLKQMQSLKFNLAWEEKDGEKQVVCPDYGNVIWKSVTDKKERGGAVYKSLFGNPETGEVGVEDRLRNAPPNTFAIIVSPEGWSGLTDADGQAIRFSESQVYAIKKTKDGSLQAYTFRYKASVIENEALQQSLGLTIPKAGDQRDRIQKTLNNVGYFSADDPHSPVKSFEDVVDKMQQSVGGRETTTEGKTFDELRLLFSHPEAFDQSHPLIDPLITRYQSYARDEVMQNQSPRELREKLEIALGMTILQFNKMYREQKSQKQSLFVHNEVYSDTRDMQKDYLMKMAYNGMDYQAEKGELEKLPGCGGGGKKSSHTSMGGVRVGEAMPGSSDYDFGETGICVVCNDGPKSVGPCNICIPCDAELGGKGASMVDMQKDLSLAA